MNMEIQQNIVTDRNNIDITKLQKKLVKSYKKLLQKWERQTNKQTKTKYKIKTKQSF